MAIKYLNNVDLSKNQLQNAVIQVLASDPSGAVAGQVYYNSTDNVLKYYNGTAWLSAGGDITEITTATSDQLTITNGSGPIPNVDIVTGAVTNAGVELATGDQIYDFVTTGVNARIQNITDPTAAQDVATKNYVDTIATGLLEYKGGYNASTNTPDLDTATNIAIDKGDAYTVTADGLFFTEQVRVGDFIIAETAIPANTGGTLADFTIVQSNVDLATAAATSGAAIKGISGYDSADFSVTAGFVSLETKTYKALIGNGSLTTVPVTHGLNSQDLMIQLFDASTNETVYADVVRTSASQVDIIFSTAPATNSIKILIQKI